MKSDAEKVVERPGPVAAAAIPAMLTVQEMAVLLRCSGRTVHRLADAGRLPRPCRVGGLVRWSGADIQAWIAAGCPTSRTTHGRQDCRN